MTRPKWLTTSSIRWMIVAALLLSVVGVRVRRHLTRRQSAAIGTRAGRPSTAAARALLAPLTEGSVVEGWTLHSLTTDAGGGLDLSFTKDGRTITVMVVRWDPSGPSPPVRVDPYVVYYSAHGDIAPVGFALARAVGAAIRPHVRSPIPPDFTR